MRTNVCEFRKLWSNCFAMALLGVLLNLSDNILHGDIILLEDTFAGSSLDALKWIGPTPFGDVEGFVASNGASTSTTVGGGSLSFDVTGPVAGGDDGIGIRSTSSFAFPIAAESLTITADLLSGTSGPTTSDRQWWTGVGFYKDNDNFFYLTLRKEFAETEITYVSDKFESSSRTIIGHPGITSIPETLSITIESTGLLTLVADSLSATTTVDPANFSSFRIFAAAVARNSGDTMKGEFGSIKLSKSVPEPAGITVVVLGLGVLLCCRSRKGN